jgi:hypothetical protein
VRYGLTRIETTPAGGANWTDRIEALGELTNEVDS